KNAFQIDSQRSVEVDASMSTSVIVGGRRPALLNAQCNPPEVLTAATMRFFTSAASLTSVLTKVVSPPPRLIVSTVSDPNRIDIADHHLRAVLRKEQRGRATNPSTPARDKPDFT